jgi:ankyrin repeat protein
MGSRSDSDRSQQPDKDPEAGRAGGAEQPSGPTRQEFAEQLEALAKRRGRLFQQDIVGRTPLFYAAEQGRIDQVREMIFSLRGTGMMPPRLALIATKDVAGLTAADVAEQHGHDEIARLLRSEEGRMEFFE